MFYYAQWKTVFLFFFILISKTFISTTKLKLAKNQAKAKQHPQAELLLFENTRFFRSNYSTIHNEVGAKVSNLDSTCFKNLRASRP